MAEGGLGVTRVNKGAFGCPLIGERRAGNCGVDVELFGVIMSVAELDEVGSGHLKLGIVRLVEAQVVHPEGVSDSTHLSSVVHSIDPLDVCSLVFHLRVGGLGEGCIGVDPARGNSNLMIVVPVLAGNGLALSLLACVVIDPDGSTEMVDGGLAGAE